MGPGLNLAGGRPGAHLNPTLMGTLSTTIMQHTARLAYNARSGYEITFDDSDAMMV